MNQSQSQVQSVTETEIKFESDVTVNLVKASASDADVIWAARVSTAGERSKDSIDQDAKAASGLINFLMRERHGTPFEHSVMTFYVKAPIFVWREHMRHRTASYNEESGRYRVSEPVFYAPDEERRLIQVGKPGAYVFEAGSDEQYQIARKEYVETCTQSYHAYQRMLDAGIAREVARGVLPVTIYSSAYVTMNSRGLMHFLSLRLKSDDAKFPSYPQREIEMVAEKYEAIFGDLMPITYRSFVENGRVSP
jgi:thymidylate synthase (FAD)